MAQRAQTQMVRMQALQAEQLARGDDDLLLEQPLKHIPHVDRP